MSVHDSYQTTFRFLLSFSQEMTVWDCEVFRSDLKFRATVCTACEAGVKANEGSTADADKRARLGGRHADAGVEDCCAVVVYDERIAIQLRDLREILDHRAYTQ